MASDVKPGRPYRTTLRQQQTDLTRERILDAARRLLVGGGYSQVTMLELAREAGVAYQTLFSRFGNKAQLAIELIQTGFPHVAEALTLLTQARDSGDPVVWLQIVGTFSRRINEPCADLFRFMRESGNPRLQGRFKEVERDRRQHFAELGAQLKQTGRLRAGLSGSDAADILWAMAGPESYAQFVLDRGWTPDRFERWLGEALVATLLNPG